MSGPQLSYFQDEDTLHLSLSDEPEAGSVEISLGLTAELNENGDLIGIEILSASAFLRDSPSEASLQADTHDSAAVKQDSRLLTHWRS
uniref:Uncharacterized protein YuzE n=1 Tax=Candidatus Kentrum eta TaxID=2126337 RepID=A0A450V4Q0_9GAMM|nr:MAG: Uncharacterized protein YuzE [Candidatus Kentron sp. H]VFJ99735.1 MAG: Uncharacterized protein YuzE [Candidatus Kentron sp. H]VFK04018.1 MAG: Uncharacterized protein YuzE [Candidatus Kentron sp. H]